MMNVPPADLRMPVRGADSRMVVRVAVVTAAALLAWAAPLKSSSSSRTRPFGVWNEA